MATPTTIADALEQAALNPHSAGTGTSWVRGQNLVQLLEVLRHERAQTAVSKNHLGLRMVKLKAPGAG